MHGMRRRILRALSEGPAPSTLDDLLTIFPGVGLSTVYYHVLVLEDCGSLARLGQDSGTSTRLLVSNVTDDAQYVLVLRATEELDEVSDER